MALSLVYVDPDLQQLFLWTGQPASLAAGLPGSLGWQGMWLMETWPSAADNAMPSLRLQPSHSPIMDNRYLVLMGIVAADSAGACRRAQAHAGRRTI